MLKNLGVGKMMAVYRAGRVLRQGNASAAQRAAFVASRRSAGLRGYGSAGTIRTGGFYGRYAGNNAELKFFDTALDFAFDATGEVPATGQLTLIPQDATESGRNGRKCTIKSIQLHGSMTYVPGASTDGTSACYLWLVLDKQCNGAAAAVGDVLKNGATMQKALINLSNSERFVILKKWKWVFAAKAGAQAAFSRDIRLLDFYKKCNIHIEYDSTAATGAITTIRSNNIFLLAGTNAGTDDLVTMDGIARLRFSDS